MRMAFLVPQHHLRGKKGEEKKIVKKGSNSKKRLLMHEATNIKTKRVSRKTLPGAEIFISKKQNSKNT